MANLTTGEIETRYDRKFYFEILDAMQETGSVNMYGAPAELTKHFDVPRREAMAIVTEWMKSKVVNDGS